MRIQVRFFAIARDRAGTGETWLELEEGATVLVAAERLRERFDRLFDILPRVAYAVNQSYVTKETVLRDGDELAVIPPVSGG